MRAQKNKFEVKKKLKFFQKYFTIIKINVIFISVKIMKVIF